MAKIGWVHVDFKQCGLFAKGLKQTETSILIGFIVLIAFCMGHASVNVHTFWKEPVIIWIISVITTGRCKSAFHEFLTDMLDMVASKVQERGYEVKPMVLPHCTWDKFGDLLAGSGGRSLGLFDEIMSFFSTMNMYSSVKMQVSDTREYQDFLQMFTGKAKSRETVTGNANFKMHRTSFTLFGFTQPFTAFPVIDDVANNAKGFTSRMLWFFPTPVYCKMRENILDDEECEIIETFKEQFVEFLADLYIHGETTYQIEEQNKVKDVSVTRTDYYLTNEALEEFEKIHDNWELDICKENPHDALVGGIYSRGKSHLLRLSVPIQLLLTALISGDSDEEPKITLLKTTQTDNESDAPTLTTATNDHHDHSQTDDVASDVSETTNEDVDQFPNTDITPEAIRIAHSLVDTCLKQLCTLSDKTHLLSAGKSAEEHEIGTTISTPTGINRLFKAVICSPGKIVSFTILNTKGIFRRHSVEEFTGKKLMVQVADQISLIEVGIVENFTIPGNKSKVFFFLKQEPPKEQLQAMEFAKKLAKLGVSLPTYCQLYNQEDDESAKHYEEYINRKNSHASPGKKRKRDTCTQEDTSISTT